MFFAYLPVQGSRILANSRSNLACCPPGARFLRHHRDEMLDTPQLGDQQDAEPGRASPPPAPVNPDTQRGCLFALSQPPLMIFLAVIGGLLLMAALHDLLLL